jgi:glycosyltransferase involved in cell wall biosynthesis
VIAADVGSFRSDVIEGKTGFIYTPEDPLNLPRKIEEYFKSDLYENLKINSTEIERYAQNKYSWLKNGKIFAKVYQNLISHQ